MLRSKRKQSSAAPDNDQSAVDTTGPAAGPLPPPSVPPVVATQPGVLAPPPPPDTSPETAAATEEVMPPPEPGVEPSTMLLASSDPSLVDVVRATTDARPGRWEVHVATDDETCRLLLGRLEAVDVLIVQSPLGGESAEAMLEHVRRRSPRTARIVLSDPVDGVEANQLGALAHQRLPSRPDIAALTQLVDHVGRAVNSTLLDPVRSLVGQVDRLPSPPTMYQRLAEIMASPDWSIDDLAAEVSTDVALTGELLRLVNSSFYGPASMVNSVRQAISLLGIDTTRVVVLGNKVFQPSDDLETWIDLDRLAGRSKVVAHGARSLSIRQGDRAERASAAYLTGMVSEIGLLVLARIPDIAPSIAAPVNVAVYPGAERALFGGDRFEVGAQLLALWGFDPSVVEAVRGLSNGDPCPAGELAWYLATARQLVLGDQFDPQDLASAPGANEALDDALVRLRSVIEGTGAVASV